MKNNYLLISTIAILLSGCFQGEEELRVQDDMSASMKLVYKMPSVFFTEEMRKMMETGMTRKIKQHPEIRLTTHRIETNNKQTIITTVLETDHMKHFRKMMTPLDGDENPGMMHTMMGEMAFERDGLAAELTRKVDISPVMQRYGIEPNMLGNSTIQYSVHMPMAASHTNAHHIENNGKTLKWTFHLRDYTDQPMLMQIHAPAPVPWWAYAILTLAILIPITLVWKFLRRRMSRKSSFTG